MNFKPRAYEVSNLVVGSLILMMSLNWVYHHAWKYYFWNFYDGWRCGVGAPTNTEILLQILFGLVGVYLSTRVIENRIRPFMGGMFQFALVCSGVTIEMMRIVRWG